MLDDLEEFNIQEVQRYHESFFKEIHKLYAIKHDSRESLKHLANLYRYLKEITPKVYIKNENYKVYNSMINLILKAEEDVFGEMIIDAYPNFTYDKHHKLDFNLEHYSSHAELLEELVYATRKRLVTSWGESEVRDLSNMNLSNRCKYVSGYFNRRAMYMKFISSFIYRNAKNMGFDVKRVIIHPGYSKESNLYNGDGYHYFNIVTIEGKEYIVDCSYAQFFTQGKNCLERLGLMDFSGCNPGVYMLQNEARTKVARELLTRGWCEATEDNMKDYLDGFTLMWRNGLYYENVGEANYEADYTIDEYMNFLYGDDDQVKHEGREFLGYQRKMLKDPTFRFLK